MYTGNINDHIVYEKIKKQQLYKDDRFHVMLLCLKEDEFLKPHYASTDAFYWCLKGQSYLSPMTMNPGW